ncbi:putative uncharacterized protein DDB_G0289963 [Aphidius gifuensis]|uniref:putative uncharacterized protein DDB_G0289963 n=1 Tax=Aphidius gifuensis TaxID=684658 RepID=UPI001CDCD0FB|nr:putative uncharacterized protein DDB_G0289963 [Aphidius gifuensis]
MATQHEESRHCLICDKIFCCEDCCTNHIKKKHPNIDVNCSLCRSGLLTIKNFSDDKFFCHVIFHHLPLHCNKCGKLFNNSSDLKNLGCCKYNLSHEKSILMSNKSNQSLETTSSSIKTPTNLIKFKSQLFDNNQKNFTSPPQFSRQTSTPMQTPVVKKNDSSTTSSSSSPASFDTNKNNKLIIQKLKINDKTPLKSILIRDDDSKYSSKYKTGRKLSSMEELDETSDMDLTDPRESVLPLANKSDETSESDMDLTDPFNGVLISESKNITSPINTVNQSGIKDLEKKVRFIDQCNESIDEVDDKNKSLMNNTNDDDEDEDDYFDACQSMSEHSSYVDKIKPTDANNSNIEYERKVETTISVRNYNDNKNSKVKMIMMIIEKNIDTSVSDLTPFIESGLRKLDKLSSNVVDKKSSCNFVDNSKNNLYVDTWQSTSKIETLTSRPSATLSPIKNDEKIATDTMKNDGIFSTVANVIKNTIRGLTNINTDKKLDTKCDDGDEPAASSTICINPYVSPSTSNYHEQQQQVDYINNNKKLPSLASNLLSKLKSPGSPLLAGKSVGIVSSTGKRRRDDLNDCNLSSDYDDDGDHDGNGCPDGQVNSPLHKRKKIWNFRSREPLSRMKPDPVSSFD